MHWLHVYGKKYKKDPMRGQNKQIHVRQRFFDADRSMAELVLWLQIPLWPIATVYHGLLVVTLKSQLQSYACTQPTALLLAGQDAKNLVPCCHDNVNYY